MLVKTLGAILLFVWLANLAIPVVLSLGGSLINFMFRTEIPFIKWAEKYQELKYGWLFTHYMEADDHAIAFFMLDLIVGFIVTLISLWLIEQSIVVWLIIAMPFIVRFITGLIKK
ncbi:hypothetical protein PVA8_38 [Vibrio phage PVA8]|uniref:Uncharacterized protein n=1 Tax=Vibrio phage V09 TaxID=2724327 RepID=A0A6H0X9V9_9CAUD|nr:hypothetical protein COHAPHLL_00365 [Vibrio phage V09]UNA01728.1 hypothetical protein [Vibrio phage PC-Liy1]URQ03024.1 hypothetical protein PVA8_38 [Vibrio phage PVA8]WBM58760.1 hypothetical protein vBValMPVA8_38 [Vibrio phage vB_ValM_PVA8]